mgnify:CR=1 FL=1
MDHDPPDLLQRLLGPGIRIGSQKVHLHILRHLHLPRIHLFFLEYIFKQHDHRCQNDHRRRRKKACQDQLADPLLLFSFDPPHFPPQPSLLIFSLHDSYPFLFLLYFTRRTAVSHFSVHCQGSTAPEVPWPRSPGRPGQNPCPDRKVLPCIRPGLRPPSEAHIRLHYGGFP